MNNLYNYIHRLIKNILLDNGYVIKRSREINAVKAQHANALRELLETDFECDVVEGVVGVVFSKDRPLQLYALLKSYLEKVKNPAKLKIMYAASCDKYQKAYEDVKKTINDESFEFYKEKSFKKDLVDLLKSSDEEKIFFLVDDILFVESLDMDDYINVDASSAIASMRLGRNLEQAYTVNADQKLPDFNVADNSLENAHKLMWKWSNGDFDWGYPLSVDGNLFLLREIKAMAVICEYQAPNSFEKALQWFNNAFEARSGVCFEKSVIVNIPFNKVQSENRNISGRVSEEELLRLWNEGYELDLNRYYGFSNISAHQELPLFIEMRE